MASESTVLARTENKTHSFFTSRNGAVLALAAAVLVLHLATGSRYGHFGDELYFHDCAKHLAWGYVDQPPMIALLVWLSDHLLGTSVFACQVFPAVASAAIVWLTGTIAREMGGGRYAQALAALCSACSAVYLASGHLFTMNIFEPLFWMGCVYLLLRMIHTGNPRLWIWIGVLTGLGLENKYSMAFFAAALLLGLLITPQRRLLATKWFWVGLALAFLIFLPNVLWNVQHHWPFFELMHNIRASGRDVILSPIGYIAAQITLMNPISALVWITGCVWLFFAAAGKPFRFLGPAFVALIVILIVLHGKDYYAAPVYPFVLAAGGVAIEAIASRRGLGWIKVALPVLIVSVTLVLLPILVPVLPADQAAHYWKKINGVLHLQPQEKGMLTEVLPHHFAWRFGWDEQVAAVARAYQHVPAAEQADTAIFAGNFASAGAIDLLGPKYGLPAAISGHQNYWLWGPRHYSGQTVILVAIPIADARRRFDEVTVAEQFHDPYAAPWENRPILLCRKPRFSSLAELWPEVKNWD